MSTIPYDTGGLPVGVSAQQTHALFLVRTTPVRAVAQREDTTGCSPNSLSSPEPRYATHSPPRPRSNAVSKSGPREYPRLVVGHVLSSTPASLVWTRKVKDNVIPATWVPTSPESACIGEIAFWR